MRNLDIALVVALAALVGSLVVGTGACAVTESVEVEVPADLQPISGLWEVTSVMNRTKGEVQPHRREFHMFSGSHQMVIVAGEGRPKLDKSFSDMTPDEIMSQMPVGAGFYRFELDGEKITRTNIAALSAYYEGKSFEGTCVIDGNTLRLRDSHSADGDEREWTMRRVE